MTRLCVLAWLVCGATLAEARPTDVSGSDLWRYDAADVVEHVDTAHFRVFFVRTGKNAVPSADADVDGTPDHVAQVGQLYEDVLAFYLQRGFLQPLSDGALAGNGGDGRFDVYLLDFAKSADGSFVRQDCTGSRCVGYMVQENDFAGYAYPSATIGNRILASHEFFHAVQAAYNADQGTVLEEGTAVWATEQFDPSLSDFEGFVAGYLSNVDRSLDRPGTGPVDAFSYGAAIFFQFLGEKVGMDVVRELLEDCVEGAQGVAAPEWFTALAALLQRAHGTTFADTFTTFAGYNLFTAGRADPSRGYARGAGYPLAESTKAMLPYEDTTLRVFYASSQILLFDAQARSQLAVTAVPLAGMDASALAALRVIVAPLKAGKITALTTHAITDATAVDLAGAEQVLVEIVSTAQAGESSKGTLCVGTADEVNACVVKNGATPTTPEGTDGGCAMVGKKTGAGISGAWVFVLLLLYCATRAGRSRLADPRSGRSAP